MAPLVKYPLAGTLPSPPASSPATATTRNQRTDRTSWSPVGCPARVPRLRAMADGNDVPPNERAAAIEAYYLEDRTFPPPEHFKKQALVTDQALYDEAAEDFQGFWARQALDLLDW